MRLSPLTLAVGVLALVGITTDALAQAKRGGTLRVAMNRTFNGFDTATNPTVFPTKLNVQRAIFEDLFGLDEAGKIIPKLGTALKISLDQKVFTVTLRKGIKFSNDEPLTARAYADHFKRALKSPMINFIRGQIGPVKEVVALDDHTVEFRDVTAPCWISGCSHRTLSILLGQCTGACQKHGPLCRQTAGRHRTLYAGKLGPGCFPNAGA